MTQDDAESDWELVDKTSSLSERAQAILTARLKEALAKQTITIAEQKTAVEKQATASNALGDRMWWLSVWLLGVAVATTLGLTAVQVLSLFQILGD
jgi:hypothetical protein